MVKDRTEWYAHDRSRDIKKKVASTHKNYTKKNYDLDKNTMVWSLPELDILNASQIKVNEKYHYGEV